ncbi:hypothetical protein G6F46_004845 [Rhizopus delemar]|uniref:Bromo domain-containing protein n=3 Tax=Rhizopus TaxID=4842 RepID=I1BMB0_RHIO9|nr:hypothetical protein RO3G_02044 [Rhizopus delemar RA 99-880]KAG1057884.1 hypothetical protein G6F43_000304 [Rhizopus delemar]KAG1551386.1 hypothetical protein G6F51_001881 [Rhizopus arrhizus]KAG1459863.1 hypothetical protein G6F55_004512 [Rhizopus delemar]KAG1496040.1 hypothetical protein G6F54_006754 [Rhizopus delemar]|eukprot:EIE77340.1 hypothetical protein RO3G_02044 [Rhizopus delemar RA 99-880]
MSYSPELSDYYSEEEEKTIQPVSTPTIKLKLKLNPSPSTASTEKKQKHKKKHKKKHRKIESEEEEDDYVEEPAVHPTAGGKRPYALIQQQKQYQQHSEDIEDNDDDDSEIYHPTDVKRSKRESFESEEEEEYYSSKQPVFIPPAQPQGPRLGRPPKQKTRRSSSTKSSTSAAEKPKKRGRPTNKAKAAALLAQLPPKIPENPKRDLKTILSKLLDNLQKRDMYGFFLEPVDPNFVPDYLKVIKSPMDFLTMSKKLERGAYTNVEDFRQDFNLIVSNAKLYNAIDTIYWKSADKLYEVGSKLIDKAEKQYEEEMALAAAESAMAGEVQDGRKSSLPVGRKDSLIKEEDVDIMGIDTNTFSLRKHSRQGSETTSIDIASSRVLTPTKSTYNKKKKKKVTETGTVYGPDGSLHAVGGVSDVAALLPVENPFCEPPQLITSNPGALPSAFYLNRQSADDFFRNKHQVHSAHFLDYGPFTTLGHQPPGAFYTAQDASYIYPLFGDDRGEAYMKSLWQFLDLEKDDKELIEIVENKSNYLTRGAWSVVKQVLERKNENLIKKKEEKADDTVYMAVETEFGPVDASSIVDKLEQKLLPNTNEEGQSVAA